LTRWCLCIFTRWAWSLIRNKKNPKCSSLWENCHTAKKSDAIACARRCWSSRLTMVVDKQRMIGTRKKWRAKVSLAQKQINK
jgi:hypothetical protein